MTMDVLCRSKPNRTAATTFPGSGSRSRTGATTTKACASAVTGLTLRAVFRLALRQTEGLIGSILRLLGLDLAVPDHSTLSRRAETLEVPWPRSSTGGEPVHLLVDSTGLKLCGAGEWLLETWDEDTPVLAQAAPRGGRQHWADPRLHADQP